MNDREALIYLLEQNLKNKSNERYRIKEDMSLIYDLGYDSLSFIQLIIEIEDNFNVDIDEFDLNKTTTVKALIQLISHFKGEEAN